MLRKRRTSALEEFPGRLDLRNGRLLPFTMPYKSMCRAICCSQAYEGTGIGKNVTSHFGHRYTTLLHRNKVAVTPNRTTSPG